MTPRELGLSFMIDANRINARQGLPAMNRLEVWTAKGLLSILISTPAHGEVEAAGSRFRQKASGYVISLDTFDPERAGLEQQIENILFPKGVQRDSDRRDVQIVAHAKKYNCILITSEGASKRQPGGMLGHREELEQKVGVKVMTDDEAAELVANRIRRRDESARHLTRVTGEELPSWVGGD